MQGNEKNELERKKWFGENGIIYNKLSNKIKIKGSDADIEEPLKILLNQKKFSKNEINAYKIYSYFPAFYLENEISPKEALIKSAKKLKIEFNNEIHDLIKNYVKKFLNKKINQISKKDDLSICPYCTNIKISKIAHETSYLRKEEIVKNIQEAIKKYKKTIAINGTNHVIRQEKFWRRLEKF